MSTLWNNKPQNVGWDIPVDTPITQPAYPVQAYPTQPSYPLHPGYAIHNAQSGAPVPSGIGYVTSGMPPPYSITGSSAVPAVSIHDPIHANPRNDAEAPKPEEDLPNNFGASFSTRAIRHAFIRKIYTIVTLQFIVTLAFVAVFTLHEDVKKFVQKNRWVYILSYIVFLITYFTIICCNGVRRKWPGNMILLSVFTLSMAYILGTIAAYYETDVVLFSIGITALVCFLITLFAVQTKIDFTSCGTYLFIASIVLFIFGIIAIVMRDNLMHLVYSGGITLLFSMV